MNKDYIYIIFDEINNSIKVGVSKNPNKRLKQLQTSNPNPLTLLFTEELSCNRQRTLQIEKLIHNEIHSQGLKQRGEWFNLKESTQIKDIIDIVTWNRIRYEQDDLFFIYGRI